MKFVTNKRYTMLEIREDGTLSAGHSVQYNLHDTYDDAVKALELMLDISDYYSEETYMGRMFTIVEVFYNDREW